MRSLVTTSSHFAVQSSAPSLPAPPLPAVSVASAGMIACASAAAPSSMAASAVPHPFPSFYSPAHPSPAEPWQFDYQQRYLKKPAEAIGYACAAQLSGNMQLSLQWDKEGQLRRWEKERPFAVREQREREERRSRGEPEEVKAIFGLFSPFPPDIQPVPAPAAFSLQQRHPLLPPQPRSAPLSSSPTLSPSLSSSNSALRVQARRLLAEAGSYDPYAAALLPFFTPQPSHYNDTYHSSASQLNTAKVNLLSHPLSSYARPPPSSYKGSNHRWTEERLFFRGYRVKDSADDDDREVEGRGSVAAAGRGAAHDLLFDAPLYSSFTTDGVYREPERRGRKRPVRWTKLPTPRMRRREDGGGRAGGAGHEVQDSLGSAVEQPASADGLGSEAQGQTMVPTCAKADIRASRVYVPRASSLRFISTSQYTAKNSRARG